MRVVAIAYLMGKTPYVFPIVGGRKVEHLMDNVKALEISLTPEQITFIESVVPFDPGFPHSMVVSTQKSQRACAKLMMWQGNGTQPNMFLSQTGTVDLVKFVDPIRSGK